MPRHLLLLLLVSILTACATSPEGRKQLLAPAPLQNFSSVYSEFDMRLQLVTAADAPACTEAECDADRAFDQRILLLGQRLAEAAYRQYPDLESRFPHFEFIVADKTDPGAASSAAGTVVIYRGVRRLNLDDAALAFVLAREMSQVIGSHHEENVTSSFLVSIAAQILLPVLNFARGAAAAVSSGAAATAASTAMSTTAMVSVASYAGARALRASYRPEQLREAEIIGMKLMLAAGWDAREVRDQLQSLRPALPDDPAWIEELRESTQHIASQPQDQFRKASQILSGYAGLKVMTGGGWANEISLLEAT
jgi:Zn-dependent protease with chaperone function